MYLQGAQCALILFIYVDRSNAGFVGEGGLPYKFNINKMDLRVDVPNKA